MQTPRTLPGKGPLLVGGAAFAALTGCGSVEEIADDAAVRADSGSGSDGAPAADADVSEDPDAGPPAAGCTPSDSTDFALELVAQGLQQPLYVTAPPDDPRLFIVTQPGRIWIIEDGQLLDAPFLDITADVEDGGNEQGLLGLAFHPDYAENGRFFLNYTAADRSGDTVVAEYQVSSDPNAAEGASEERLLVINQSASNHNGGMVEFGPQGYLHIGMGDEGNADDSFDNAQNLETLHGSLLRIDVDAAEDPYGIPDDNPFVDETDARDEIWAYGLRNAWRFSFDREDDTLYIGDVGQNQREEVNGEPASAAEVNYGWPCFEGTLEYDPEGHCDDLVDPDFTAPVHEYENASEECSVTGGYAYRGECLLGLEGRYLFGDYCSNRVWSFDLEGGEATDVQELTDNLDPEGSISGLSSFGEDAYGELYVTSIASGEVYRIVTADAE